MTGTKRSPAGADALCRSCSTASPQSCASRLGLPFPPPGNRLPDCPARRNERQIAHQACRYPYRTHSCRPSLVCGLPSMLPACQSAKARRGRHDRRKPIRRLTTGKQQVPLSSYGCGHRLFQYLGLNCRYSAAVPACPLSCGLCKRD